MKSKSEGVLYSYACNTNKTRIGTLFWASKEMIPLGAPIYEKIINSGGICLGVKGGRKCRHILFSYKVPYKKWRWAHYEIKESEAKGVVGWFFPSGIPAKTYYDLTLRFESLRRAYRKKGRGSYTRADVQKLWDIQKGRCYWSGVSLGVAFDEARFTVDHVKPLCAGGLNTAENLVLCISAWNFKKHGNKVDWFLEKYPKLNTLPLRRMRRNIDQKRYALFTKKKPSMRR